MHPQILDAERDRQRLALPIERPPFAASAKVTFPSPRWRSGKTSGLFRCRYQRRARTHTPHHISLSFRPEALLSAWADRIDIRSESHERHTDFSQREKNATRTFPEEDNSSRGLVAVHSTCPAAFRYAIPNHTDG